MLLIPSSQLLMKKLNEAPLCTSFRSGSEPQVTILWAQFPNHCLRPLQKSKQKTISLPGLLKKKKKVIKFKTKLNSRYQRLVYRVFYIARASDFLVEKKLGGMDQIFFFFFKLRLICVSVTLQKLDIVYYFRMFPLSV